MQSIFSRYGSTLFYGICGILQKNEKQGEKRPHDEHCTYF